MSVLPTSYDDWRLRAPGDEFPEPENDKPEGYVTQDEWHGIQRQGILESLSALAAVDGIDVDYFDDKVQLGCAVCPPEPQRHSNSFDVYCNPDTSCDVRQEMVEFFREAAKRLESDIRERPRL